MRRIIIADFPATILRLRRPTAAIAVALIVAGGLLYTSTERADAAEVCTGPGCDTVAFVNTQARFDLFEDLTSSSDVGSFVYGNPGDEPLMGDWDCDGDQTPAMYRRAEGFMYLRNSNTQGVADLQFHYGNPGDAPLAGDFNGDGCDTLSIYRPSEGRVYISNELGNGPAEYSYYFGNPGDSPFVGDFDGDGVDTIGLHRVTTGLVYFRNSHAPGVADESFVFGDPNDLVFAGDWNGDGIETVGAFRPSSGVLYLQNRNAAGFADHELEVGSYRHAIPSTGIGQVPPSSGGGGGGSPIDDGGTTTAMPLGIPGDWRLIMNEPFNWFNPEIWQPRHAWTPTIINGELQAYLPSAVSVYDGNLHLTATDEGANGQPYTSGVITSYEKFAFLYGAAEMRAKLPEGPGFHPAFWMLPNNEDYPPELDIVEMTGSQPYYAHIGYHWPQGDGIASEFDTHVADQKLTDGFHTYSVSWDPGLVVWYVDGVEIHRFSSPQVASQEMYLLANLALAAWVDPPDNTTPFPSEMVVDYIRVWQRR